MSPADGLTAPAPPLKLLVDADALVHNWRALDGLSGGARAGAAVKANAYGLGVARVAPALAAAGCRDFFVAHWSEVAALVRHVDAASISVLHGPLSDADAEYARALGVKPVINSAAQARLWLAAGGGRCDLMVDTGMNRLGLSAAELADDAVAQLDIDVMLSHLVSADEDSPLNETQRQRWRAAQAHIRARRFSLANSAGIALGHAYHGDLTRPGLALYGGVPHPALSGVIRQVARPMAAILQVREVAAGDTLGYNATFTAPAPMRVGTIALGYADGYLRRWSGKGVMLAGERRLSVLGRVSMDMTIIDLSCAPELREGDWVEAQYALPEAAVISGLSQYELVTSLGRRFGG